MMIDVEICGQLLIAWRREEHLKNVAVCINVRFFQNSDDDIYFFVQLLADSLSRSNELLKAHYESHLDTLGELERRTKVFGDLDVENVKVDETFQATNTLRYETEQFVLSEVWHTASPSRHKVFELRDKVFGTEHGSSGDKRMQWSIDGHERLVDHIGRTESEAEEERRIIKDESSEEEEENTKSDKSSSSADRKSVV